MDLNDVKKELKNYRKIIELLKQYEDDIAGITEDDIAHSKQLNESVSSMVKASTRSLLNKIEKLSNIAHSKNDEKLMLKTILQNQSILAALLIAEVD